MLSWSNFPFLPSRDICKISLLRLYRRSLYPRCALARALIRFNQHSFFFCIHGTLLESPELCLHCPRLKVAVVETVTIPIRMAES